MSQEELRRVEVLARVLSGQLRVVDASRLLGVSYRQTKRLWKRYREEGPASLETNRDVLGPAQRESSLLEPLDAKFLKKRSAEAERARRQQTQNTKRGHF